MSARPATMAERLALRRQSQISWLNAFIAEVQAKRFVNRFGTLTERGQAWAIETFEAYASEERKRSKGPYVIQDCWLTAVHDGDPLAVAKRLLSLLSKEATR